MRSVVKKVLDQYVLDPGGIHGVRHWARVLENGRRLAEASGASVKVVELFAVFHDACRRNDWRDPEHGPRGAALARSLRGDVFDLDEAEFKDLVTACTFHTRGRCEGTATVRTCWDADRLDLGRVGVQPDPQRLCTEAARTPVLLDWASNRGFEEWTAPWLASEWGIHLE